MPYESSAQYEPLEAKRLHSKFRAAFRLTLFILWTLFICATQPIIVWVNREASLKWLVILHKVYCRIMGMKIQVRGKPCTHSPCLYVANHTTYADIMTLGSCVKGSFIAKKEIEKWPVIGRMTSLQQGIFVERRREHAAAQSKEIQGRLNAGDNLMLFPEGTSTDGQAVLPFKSSLFAMVKGVENLAIQPVSISYVMLDGMPLGNLRPRVSWYGDMTFLPHLWGMLGMGKITVIIDFSPPLIDELNSLGRKEIAAIAQSAVADSHAKALREPVPIKIKKQKNA